MRKIMIAALLRQKLKAFNRKFTFWVTCYRYEFKKCNEIRQKSNYENIGIF